MTHTFLMPEAIISGEYAVEQGMIHIPDTVKKALLVTAECNVELGLADRVTNVLKKENRAYCIYAGVNTEPTDNMIEEGVRLYQEEGCDYLIAVGGGSVLDAMKAIGLLVSNGGNIVDYMGRKSVPNPLPFMIAVPTTAGTGSEATQFTIITDTEHDVKMLIGMKALIPNLVLLVPELTLTVPRPVTVSTGMDALIHGIEAYISKRAQPMTDRFALSAVERIFRNLPIVYMDGTDRTARQEMAYGALEAGIAFSNSSVTLIHGMSRPIGVLFHVPHGLSNAILLEHCMEFMADSAPERLGNLAVAVGAAEASMEEKQKVECFLKALSELCRTCKVPTLQEFGIEKERFLRMTEKMAEDALVSGSPQNLRKAVGKGEMIAIYQKLWD